MLRDPHFWAYLFFGTEWVLRLVMLVVVPLRRSPAAAKGWLLLVFFEPVVGFLLYLMIGSPKTPAWRREKLKELAETLRPRLGKLRGHPNVFHPDVGAELDHAVTLAESLGHMPILGGNTAELWVDYEATLARLVEEIDGARLHVHLLYYIFADDQATEPIVAALGRAAARGVPCRVLIDSVGSRRPLRTLAPKLRELGVQVREMLPIGLLRRKAARFDLRNHRKIAVFDGRAAYTGSMNLVDARFKEGLTYEELVVRVTGPVVLELQYVFLSDWYLESGEVLEGADIFPEPEAPGTAAAQVLPSGPDFMTANNQRIFVSLVHGARKRVTITTPYFVPDEPLLQALQTAVLRGVDVNLICSRKEDQLLVSLAQRSYYRELLEAGVRIHLYRDNFLHAKHMSVDDKIALIGSSNMDIRSFLLNNEISVIFYDTDVAERLREVQEKYLENCATLRMEDWDERAWPGKVAEGLARLMSPLL